MGKFNFQFGFFFSTMLAPYTVEKAKNSESMHLLLSNLVVKIFWLQQMLQAEVLISRMSPWSLTMIWLRLLKVNVWFMYLVVSYVINSAKVDITANYQLSVDANSQAVFISMLNRDYFRKECITGNYLGKECLLLSLDYQSVQVVTRSLPPKVRNRKCYNLNTVSYKQVLP